MKFRNILAGIIALCALTGSAQNGFIGSWSGSIDLGTTKLLLVFNMTQENDGIKCTLDSPNQGAKGIRTSVAYSSADSITVKITSIGADYRGKLTGDSIVGVFSQMGYEFPLILSKKEIEHRRPQTPRPPFEYKTQELDIRSDSVHLSGTLTYPIGFNEKNATPIVIMVSGSGQQNRDEEIFDHKPFAVIADYLARNGIASFRYDDRGFAKSTGDAKTVTIESNISDALACVDAIRKMNQFSKVGIIGHSEGGTIALTLAGRHKIDFAVSLAGAVLNGGDILAEQNSKLLQISGIPANIATDYGNAVSIVLKDNSGKEINTLLAEAQIVSIPTQLVANLDKVRSSKTPWLESFVRYDVSSDIKQIKCPVMALNGEKDTQVIASSNLNKLKTLLPANDKSSICEYPGLNHLFQPCTTGLVTEYIEIDTTISDDVLKDIAKWIIEATK